MKVWPTSDDIRKVLAHPTGGPFRDEGPTEWPDDVYTYKQIQDGSVTTKEPAAPKSDEHGASAAKPKTSKEA
jgi:hypothetical protein